MVYILSDVCNCDARWATASGATVHAPWCRSRKDTVRYVVLRDSGDCESCETLKGALAHERAMRQDAERRLRVLERTRGRK
jgi:hypothetical protein